MAGTKTPEANVHDHQARRDFARIPTIIDLPDLIEVQQKSYTRFLQQERPPLDREDRGLEAVFHSVFPISDFNGTASLEYVGKLTQLETLDFTNAFAIQGHGLRHLASLDRLSVEDLLTAFAASAVINLFQDSIEKVVALAVLMPIVASMGGIAGSQTLTLVIRGLALGQVEASNARWILFKEIAIGLLNGVGWALVVALATVAWFRSWDVAAVIAAAMVINLFVAAMSGVVVPIILKRMKIDPALAGGVVLTTITDVIGFMAFLGLGTIFLT